MSQYTADEWGKVKCEVSFMWSLYKSSSFIWILCLVRHDTLRLFVLKRGFFSDVHMDSSFCKYNTWGSEGSSVSCQKWELRICFLSRNMYSVVETVNDIGLSCAGSGTSNDVCAPLLSRKTWYGKPGIHDLTMTIFCAAFLYVWVTSLSTWLTEETLEEPRHYMICGERRSHRGAVEHVSKHSHHSAKLGLKVSAGSEQEKDAICKT